MSQVVHVELMNPAEAAAKYAAEMAANDAAERARTAAGNRLRGCPEPKPGDRLYVTTARGLKQRARAGLVFRETEKTAVEVIHDDQPRGANQVYVYGAETILADHMALNVSGQTSSEADAARLRSELEAARAELAQVKREAADAAKIRDARRNATDKGDGSPSRLKAAAAARGKSEDGDFGA